MKSKKLLLCSLLLAGLLTTATGCSTKSESGLVHKDNIEMKLLSTGTDSENHITKTFTYSVLPSNASNPSVGYTLKYADGTDCSSAIGVSIDEDNKRITLTNLTDFSKQIIFTLYSKENSNIKSSLTIDYEKKLKSLDLQDVYYRVDYQETRTHFSDSIKATYSQFTTNKIYTYTLNSSSCFKLVVDDATLSSKYADLLEAIEQQWGDRFPDLSTIIENSSDGLPSVSEWLAFANESFGAGNTFVSQWSCLLQDLVDNSKLMYLPITLKFTCDQDSSFTITKEVKFYFDLKGLGYTDFHVSTSSVSTEVSSITF